MPQQLHETIMGRELFDGHIPAIRRALERIATSLEEANEIQRKALKVASNDMDKRC